MSADAETMMGDLEPVLGGEEYGFASLPGEGRWPADLAALATFAEKEGASVIATVDALAAAGFDHRAGWARISLRLASALDGVGLTAAIAGALAEAGISANIVAAYHHDHVFVPWTRRHEALAILANLSEPRE